MRIAVIDREKCKPDKCGWLCFKVCPRNRAGDACITKGEKAEIDEHLCIGCGICVKKCPYEAIQVVNTPEELKEEPIHRFGKNMFVLYRLPIPIKGEVTGILGPNGVGKTTALRVLSGELKPDIGEPGKTVEWSEVSHMFRGSELQQYFTDLEGGMKTVYKPQHLELSGSVKEFLEKSSERGILGEVLKKLSIEHTLDRNLEQLSGGELQRVAIASAVCKEGDIYYFDEPSSFLDVHQRLEVGKLIRKLAKQKTVVAVEHDLATLDFLADKIHIFYGVPGAYGVVSKPYGVRVGINIFLDGYIKEDNVRIRKEPITFEVRAPSKLEEREVFLEFSEFKKKLGDFELYVESGKIHKEEILGVFGANALGKTTFAKILAGVLKPDSGEVNKEIKISYKPQYISADFDGTVLELLSTVVKNVYSDDYKHSIIRPLDLERLLDKKVKTLSGGELQRVAIALCLSRDCELYLLDEPSAYLDVEQRLNLAKVIQRVINQKDSAALVVDHDILFLDYISERGMVFVGEPGKRGQGLRPTNLKTSFNTFLKNVGVTFRRDPQTGRPRANKPDSVKDREQKEKGQYYYTD